MALTIPNTPGSPTAEQSSQSGPDQRDFDALVLAYDETYVVTGCAVTGNANLLPSVSAGMVCVGGVPALVTGGTVTITTADATNPRIDLIVADNAGTLSVVAGTPAAAFDSTHAGPVMPAWGAGHCPIASVYVAATATSIATADCTDKRVIISRPKFVIPQAADVLFTVSNTTFQSIPNLLTPITASATEVWEFAGMLEWNAVNPTMDGKLQFTGPAGATMRWGALGSPAAGNGYIMTAVGTSPGAMDAIGNQLNFGSANLDFGVPIAGKIYGGGTAGNVQLQAAQQTSDAGQLKLYKGASLKVWKLIV